MGKALRMVVGAALLASCAVAGETKRERLAGHETVAEFTGTVFHRCMGRTSLCPEKCGDSGERAEFRIRGYLSYEKTGEYGDPKQAAFSIQISDFNRKAVGDEAVRKTIAALKPGDLVLLSWNHDYVTRDGSSFPERPLTKLEAIPPDQVRAALDKAAPVAGPKEGGARPAVRSRSK